MRRTARPSPVAAAVVAACAVLAACSDPPPAPPKATAAQGAPIAGAPIDAPPAPAPAPQIGDVSTADERGPEDQPVPPNPAARHPAAAETTSPEKPSAQGPSAPAPAAEPSAAKPPTPAEPPAGERPAGPAPEVPAPAPAQAAAEAPSAPLAPIAPIAPTTAERQPKPDLQEKTPAPAAEAQPATPAPAAGERKSFVPKDHKKGEPIVLSWDQLASFDFVPPPPAYPDPETGVVPDQTAAIEAAKKQIPEEIWELEGQLVTVEGYMIPLEYADDGVKAFLLSRHAMGCCFGVMPRPHELVECDMGAGKSVPYVGYVPVTITGVLHVGLKEGPQTVLAGIYRMDAPKLTIPKEY